MSFWIKLLSFLSGLEKLFELADSYWKRGKRKQEIKQVEKENVENKELVKDGKVDELNEKFGWKEK